MNKLVTAALVSLLLLVAACSSSVDGPVDGQPEDAALAESPVGEWVLDTGTLDGEPFPLVDGWRITMTLRPDGTITGTAACNGYGGMYSLDDSTLRLTEVGQTLMGCEPAVMDSEAAFHTVLQSGPSVERIGDVLAMRGDGFELTFSAIAPVLTSELVGTTWVLDTIFAGDTASSVQGEALLRLNADGTMVGSTGCRDLVGRYVVSGDSLVLPQLAAEGDCPDGLQAQDSAVISVLENAQIEVTEDRLTLTSSGNEGLGYRAQ